MAGSAKVLLVYLAVPLSYWGFQYGLELVGKRASMPPLGLLTVAAISRADRQSTQIREGVRWRGTFYPRRGPASG